MAHYRVQIGFQMDSAFPRDVVTINPHYQGDDPQALADRLKANLNANAILGATFPYTIKVYDTTKPAPNYPLVTVTNGTGSQATSMPRELALCLSYYATWNRKSFRGRLYIPAYFVGGAIGLRPTTQQQNNCLAFKTVLTSGLPAGTWWEVWSKKLQSGAGVTHVWCDNEWDTMRSRGLRGETRVLGTVP